jgi:hypothetical protein
MNNFHQDIIEAKPFFAKEGTKGAAARILLVVNSRRMLFQINLSKR